MDRIFHLNTQTRIRRDLISLKPMWEKRFYFDSLGLNPTDYRTGDLTSYMVKHLPAEFRVPRA